MRTHTLEQSVSIGVLTHEILKIAHSDQLIVSRVDVSLVWDGVRDSSKQNGSK